METITGVVQVRSIGIPCPPGTAKEKARSGSTSMTPLTDRYIWHETIQTQHTRRSFLSEVHPGVLAIVQERIKTDRFALPGGYECVITYRAAHCLQAEVYTPAGVRLVEIGIADHPRCGQPMWVRLGGAPDARPREPWCVASLDPAGAASDPEAYQWLGDFERCLAWAWLEGQR